MNKRWFARTAILIGALGVAAIVSAKAPRDQSVHVELGLKAPEVREVRLRYTDAAHPDAEPAREVSFLYNPHDAPKMVTHDPHLPNGKYTIELEVHTEGAIVRSRKMVTLSGDPITLTTFELFQQP